MIFSAIAGWFVKKFWPTGVQIAVLIAAINAAVQFIRSETVNANREFAGRALEPNGMEIVFGGFAIDVAINIIAFSVVWGLRRKFKPHAETLAPNSNDEASGSTK